MSALLEFSSARITECSKICCSYEAEYGTSLQKDGHILAMANLAIMWTAIPIIGHHHLYQFAEKLAVVGCYLWY